MPRIQKMLQHEYNVFLILESERCSCCKKSETNLARNTFLSAENRNDVHSARKPIDIVDSDVFYQEHIEICQAFPVHLHITRTCSFCEESQRLNSLPRIRKYSFYQKSERLRSSKNPENDLQTAKCSRPSLSRLRSSRRENMILVLT